MQKVVFIEQLKCRTRAFAVNIIKLCGTLQKSQSSKVISYQLIKSATSVGANYRANCRARLRAKFFCKLSIVVEEADETMFWLEILKDTKLASDLQALSILENEALEITKIMSKSRKTTSNNK